MTFSRILFKFEQKPRIAKLGNVLQLKFLKNLLVFWLTLFLTPPTDRKFDFNNFFGVCHFCRMTSMILLKISYHIWDISSSYFFNKTRLKFRALARKSIIGGYPQEYEKRFSHTPSPRASCTTKSFIRTISNNPQKKEDKEPQEKTRRF